MAILPTPLMPGTPPAGSALHDPVLRCQWFVVAQSSEVPFAQPIARRLLGSDIVLWRDSNSLHVWQDLCIHRGAKLSLGAVRNSQDSTIKARVIAVARGTRRVRS